jgi:uncharacterized protein YcnI
MKKSVRWSPVGLVAGVILIVPSPVAAFATIPQDEVFAREGRREVLHVRVQEGCEDAATDRVEVEIPESVLGVIPEAVPGWTLTTEVVETEPYELFGQRRTDRVGRLVWEGGPLPAEQFQDFGFAAVFTESADELAIPVIQGCETVEQAWVEVPQDGEDRSDLPFPAPVVSVVDPPDTDISGLQRDLRQLRGELDDLRTEFDGLRLGEIPGDRLRERVGDLDRRLAQIEEELEQDDGTAEPS